MTLIRDELKIIHLEELFDKKLTIPIYQRLYSWNSKSANTLFSDTYEAFKNGIEEYRLGSIILHREDSGRYNIVDGQQRLTTLAILLYSLGYKESCLLDEKYSDLSNDIIIRNFRVISKRVDELKESENKCECESYKNYLLKQCTVVQIVTTSEQEAFQFFDSQNSRGRELVPHDLLKSYHLREMNNEEETEKINVINDWENIDQDNLSDLFKTYLYPLTQWYKGRGGLDYSLDKIDSFKGIRHENIFNYAVYHKASALFIEQFNRNDGNKMLLTRILNQFQLTQPLISGKRFFRYTIHYDKLLEKIQKEIKRFHQQDQIPDKRSGDIYIKQLYECSLLFFADRFGLDSLTQPVVQQLYSWSYSLRLAMYAVYPQTINKYAKGEHERINHELNMFYAISEMMDPKELNLIELKKPTIDGNNKERYKAVYELICKWNRW